MSRARSACMGPRESVIGASIAWRAPPAKWATAVRTGRRRPGRPSRLRRGRGFTNIVAVTDRLSILEAARRALAARPVAAFGRLLAVCMLLMAAPVHALDLCCPPGEEHGASVAAQPDASQDAPDLAAHHCIAHCGVHLVSMPAPESVAPLAADAAVAWAWSAREAPPSPSRALPDRPPKLLTRIA